MTVKFNVSGSRRTALAKAIAEFTGKNAVYQGPPSFAYTVGNYTIGRNGELEKADGIAPEEWEKVQTEVEYRKLRGNHCNSLNPFCFKIVCGECGDHYGKKVWHSTDPKYRKNVWHCNLKYLRETGCSTPFITDVDIKILFIRAVRKLSVDDGTVLETCMLAKETLADASAEEDRG